MPDVLALHGFTQRGDMWRELARAVGGSWRAPDLPGHGSTPAMGWVEAVDWAAAMFGEVEVVIGYSMGGRLALAAALVRPVHRLVLVSTAPGIAGSEDRNERRNRDWDLASRIERIGIDGFTAEWAARPMFAGLGLRSGTWRARDLAMRRTNAAEGLAEALRRLGQGAQPYLGDRLAAITAPVLLVVGGRDRHYAALAQEMACALRHGSVTVVPGAGHGVVGENPAAVAAALGAWWGGAAEAFTPEHTFD